MTTGLNAMMARVGGEKNAALLAGAGGVGLVWFIGRRKNAKATTAPVNVMAQGYSDTADDPTAVYTGYDQLQQEIDALRNQPAGAPNSNPVPVPTSPAAPAPVAPTPDPAVAEHQTWGAPLPSNAPPPAQQLGPAPFWNPPFGGITHG